VSKDTQDTWARIFANADRQYARAPVVAFTSGTQTGCGPASAATGPFYCPADNKVYLDLSFYQELSRRFGAPGDFAWAYVVAHEIGHHVQSVLGIEGSVRRQQQDDPGNANLYLVRLELQADCFAGVWAHSTYERGVLEPGDVDEGLRAAAAVGDDRLGARSPEQWTHGSSALRTEWFRRGFESGNPDDCDTGDVRI
jgi:predicted metalloprotease